MEVKTDLYAIKILQSFVIVNVCNNYEETHKCDKKITESFVKKCVGKTLTNYILGGK